MLNNKNFLQPVRRKDFVLAINSSARIDHLASIGYSSKQIAAEMKIATNTVDNHRQSMLKKTNSKSTGELVNFAIKAGLV